MAQEVENWKPIPVEELKKDYEVSDQGNVRNKKTGNVFKPKTVNGYKTVNIRVKGKSKYISISRMVLLAFIGEDETKPICNHKDGNKLNNRLDNLEWTTQKENIQHALQNNLVGLHNTKIKKYDKEDNFIAEYNSINEAATENNISRHSISKVLNGVYKVGGGFVWKYSNEDNIKKEIDLSDFETIEEHKNYMVSKKGEVYSVVMKKLLKPVKNDNGHTYVSLCDAINGKKKRNCYVHVLVAKTFLPNDYPDFDINVFHKDGNKSNNHVNNLKWVSSHEIKKAAKERKRALVQSQNEESSDGARENLAVMA